MIFRKKRYNMEIKFPEQENPFPKTMLRAVVSCLFALAIGLFLGNALGALFGTDESVINTSIYTDYMSATKSIFVDADQLDSYMNTAQNFLDMNGLRLYSSKNHDKMLASYNGTFQNAEDMFDEDIMRSLYELMNTDDALYGLETTGGSPIEDIRLWNLAVEDNVVYYYLYYDEAGYIGIAYDHHENVLTDSKLALPLTQNNAGDTGMWYIIYDMGE